MVGDRRARRAGRGRPIEDRDVLFLAAAHGQPHDDADADGEGTDQGDRPDGRGLLGRNLSSALLVGVQAAGAGRIDRRRRRGRLGGRRRRSRSIAARRRIRAGDRSQQQPRRRASFRPVISLFSSTAGFTGFFSRALFRRPASPPASRPAAAPGARAPTHGRGSGSDGSGLDGRGSRSRSGVRPAAARPAEAARPERASPRLRRAAEERPLCLSRDSEPRSARLREPQ